MPAKNNGQKPATQKYKVVDGVGWINGVKVPPSRMVILTPAQALFEVSNGRVFALKAKKN